MNKAECFGGPKDGDYVNVPDLPTYFYIPKPVSIRLDVDRSLLTSRLVIGTYEWNRIHYRWDWKGWDDDVPK